MRYPVLATALSLVLSGGVALAEDADTAPPPQTSQPAQPAQPSQTPPPSSMDSSQTTTHPTTTTQAEPTKTDIDVFFKTASAKLSDEGTAQLTQLGTWARCSPRRAIILDGHADPRGTADYNVKLSAQRVASARQALLDAGVPTAQIVVAVYGENGPRRATFAEDRRVSARSVEGPVAAADVPPTKTAG